MFELKNIVMGYEVNKEVLHNVSFKINKGKTTLIIGPNGAGKTTIIKVLLGLINYQQGEVYFDGEKIEDKLDRNQRKVIGYIPDEVALNNYLTVNENIEYFTVIMGNQFKQELVDQMIVKLGLENYKEQLAKNLSKGTKQKVQLAYLLLNETRFIIMDEPTVGLDIVTKNKLSALISDMKKEGVTFLITSHDLSFCEAVYDDAIFINDGNVIDIINNREKSLSNHINSIY